jgi:hypothetical protein
MPEAGLNLTEPATWPPSQSRQRESSTLFSEPSAASTPKGMENYSPPEFRFAAAGGQRRNRTPTTLIERSLFGVQA